MSSLFQLIKSLKKSEKRYFKIYAQSFVKEESMYVKLFDAIDKQEEYNEKDLQEKFQIKHISVAKKYLFDAILKSMRNYQTEHHQGFQLLDALKNISILRNKGLIKEAIKIYEKTEKQLLDNHLYTFLIELLNTGEVLWASYLPNKEVTDKLVELNQEKLKYIAYLETTTSFRALARDIKNALRILHPIRNEEQETEIQAFLQHKLLTENEESQIIIAQSLYYECITLCNLALLNYQIVQNNAQEAVELLLEQKNTSIIYYKTLIANLSNLLLASAFLRNEEVFQKYDLIYQKLQKKINGKLNKRLDVILQKLYYNYLLHYYIERSDFIEIVKLEKEIVKFWRGNDDFLDTDWRMTVSFFLAQSFFFDQNLNKAQEWTEIILEEEKNNPKIPCICNARILNLMIHYEKGNFMLLYSLFRSTYRYLNKNERLFKCERALLNFFKWLGENSNAPNLPDKFLKLIQLLENLKDNKYEKNFFKEMKLDIWIKEKKKQIVQEA